MGRSRRVSRISFRGATRASKGHREDLQPSELTEAENLMPMRSDHYLSLRPDLNDFGTTIDSVLATDYTEYATAIFDNAAVQRVVMTNRLLLEYDGSNYVNMTPEITTATASNSAAATTITLSDATTTAAEWVGRLVYYEGETEYYLVASASTTSLTVSRTITSSHSSATLHVLENFRGIGVDWPVKRCTFTQTDILMPEPIVGAINADDLNAPMFITPSKTMTSLTGAVEDRPTSYGQIGSSAPTNVAANPTSGGSLGAGTYYYQVAAKDSLGRGDLSVEVSATADASHPTIQVTWDAMNGVSDYYVWRGTVSGTMTEYATVTGAHQLNDNGGVSWTTAAPSTLEYRSGLTLQRLWGNQAGGTSGVVLAVVEDSGGTKYLFRRKIATEDDLHNVDFSSETIYAVETYWHTLVLQSVVAVLTDSDVYISTDSGNSFSATSWTETPDSGDVLGVTPGNILIASPANSNYDYYTIPSGAWAGTSTETRVASVEMIIGSSPNNIFLLVGEGCVYRFSPTGSFAGSFDVVAEDPNIPSPYMLELSDINQYSHSRNLVIVPSSMDYELVFQYATDMYSQDPSHIGSYNISDPHIGDITGTPTRPFKADQSYAFNIPSLEILDATDGSLWRASFWGNRAQKQMDIPTAAGSDTPILVAQSAVPNNSYSIFPDEDALLMWAFSDGDGTYLLSAPMLTTVHASVGDPTVGTIDRGCVAFTVVGGYLIVGGTTEDGMFRDRRIRWAVPGTFNTWVGEGAGFADLPGNGRILSLATVGNNVVVFEEHGIGLLSQRGLLDEPFSYHPAVEGITTICNPVVVNSTAYFIDQTGTLFSTNGMSLNEVGTSFDLTEHDDFSATTPVWMEYSEDLGCLTVWVSGSSTLYVVNPVSGAWTTFTLPVLSDSGDVYPSSVFQASTSGGGTELCVGYQVLSGSPTNLVIGSYDFGAAIRGKDTISSQVTHWCGKMTTGAIQLSQGGSRATVRGVTLETYCDGTDRPHAGIRMLSTDNNVWRDAGDDNGTMTVGSSAVTGSGTYWSNTVAAGDDSTTVFSTPWPAADSRIYLYDGSTTYTAQTEGTDYTVTATRQITFSSAPTSSEYVMCYYDGDPAVTAAVGDLVREGDDIHLVETIPTATSMTLDWYPSSSATGHHLPARQLPSGEGEIEIGCDVLILVGQLRVYLYPEDAANSSTVAQIKAARLSFTADGREEEDTA